MSKLRILVVEDEEKWREELRQMLADLDDEASVHLAIDYNTALDKINNNIYDLALVDLNLPGDVPKFDDPDAPGLGLLAELRNSQDNQDCALIVLTGYGTTDRIRQALREYNAFDFVEKSLFDDEVFIKTTRAALLDAQLRQAETKYDTRYRLTLEYNQTHLLSSELHGPERRAFYTVDRPEPFDVADLTRRADNLNLLITKGGPDLWRPEARSIGQQVYKILTEERRIFGDLMAARALVERADDLWVQFSGPAMGLGTPFELFQDGQEHLCLNHIFSRRLVESGVQVSRKPEPFHQFIEGLYKQQDRLRVLIVGANSDGNIPAAEVEATILAQEIKADLQHLGLASEITLLTGADAGYTKVREALQDGRYHLFHYAGHGQYDDSLPESSGLILSDSGKLRRLTASTLNLLLRDTDMRLVFLSACLGARTAGQVGRGDFHGTMSALAQADIPTILGYRWSVADYPAKHLAQTFYQTLWGTFSPGEALLQARRNIAMGEKGFDDDTWAAPVLLMQNG